MPHRFEPREVPIERYHLATMLDRNRGDHSVRDKIACGVGFLAEFSQERDMAWPGVDRKVMRLGRCRFDERECVSPRARHLEDSVVGG